MGQKVHPLSFRALQNESFFHNYTITFFHNKTLFSSKLNNFFVAKKVVSNFFYKFNVFVDIEKVLFFENPKNIRIMVNLYCFHKESVSLIQRSQIFLEKILSLFVFHKPVCLEIKVNVISTDYPNRLNLKTWDNLFLIKYCITHFKIANLLGNVLVMSLEKNLNHSLIITKFQQKINFYFNTSESMVIGYKVQVKGRLNGSDRSKKEIFSKGSIPLQTKQNCIDFTYQEAHTPYGICGVKVWLLYK